MSQYDSRICHYCRKLGHLIKICRVCLDNEGPGLSTNKAVLTIIVVVRTAGFLITAIMSPVGRLGETTNPYGVVRLMQAHLVATPTRTMSHWRKHGTVSTVINQLNGRPPIKWIVRQDWSRLSSDATLLKSLRKR